MIPFYSTRDEAAPKHPHFFCSTNQKRSVIDQFVDAVTELEKRETSQGANLQDAAGARRWGWRLAADVQSVLSLHPDADPEIVRLTLISLQSPPLERLNRSLRRGRGFAAFRR
jgi:hypothetical protein